MQDAVRPTNVIGAAKSEEYGVRNSISLRIEEMIACTLAVAAFIGLTLYMIVHELRKDDRAPIANGAKGPRFAIFNEVTLLIKSILPFLAEDVTAKGDLKDSGGGQRIFGRDNCSKPTQMI